MDDHWTRRIARGAAAGLAGGAVSALLLWVAVEPSIQQAIDLENAAADDHSHDGADAVGYDHGELVTRTEQMVGGTITVVVVGVLLGIAFAAVYALARHRLPGKTDLGRSMTLAALAFVVIGLLPAVKVPANPPAVGDPDTVADRTLSYLGTILLGALLVTACFAATRAVRRRTENSKLWWITGVATAAIGGAVILFVVPTVVEEIPANIPSSLMWRFRIGSLVQLAGLWLGIGLAYGALERRQPPARHPSASPATTAV